MGGSSGSGGGPGVYVKGVDTDGDGTEDETSGTVTGNLVIDSDASVTSTNGQEDYVFGSSSADARHWDRHVHDVFEEHSDELAELFN